MRPAFAGHPAWAAVLLLSVVVWVALELRQGLNRRPDATESDRGSLLLLRLLPVGGALVAATMFRVTAASFSYGGLAFAATLGLMWVGIGLRWWSFRTLGRYFTFTVMTSPDQPVITSGPYRVLRHPGYLGILLIIVGLSLTWANWLSVAALLIPTVVGFIKRIRVEEAALTTTLGPRYSSYASSRKRLVPYVW